MTKKGQTHATGALNVRPLCITAISMDDRAEGTLALTITTISTADTALQLVDTEPSRNRALHAAPAANGRLVMAVLCTNWEGGKFCGGAAAVEDHESVEATHKLH